ncbi:swi5-like zinc finger protein [Cryptotrichosporon argae]
MSPVSLLGPHLLYSSHQPSPNPRIAELEKQIASLRTRLNGADPVAIEQAHIKRLHEYNEVKDSTQALIGKLAVMTGTTVRAIHEGFGLPLREE